MVTILNNRPLGYVEDDNQMPVLIPSLMLFGQPNQFLKKHRRCRKRTCGDVRASYELDGQLRALRERHNLNHQTKEVTLKEGDVMLIKGEECNRGKWNIGLWNASFKDEM